MKCLDKSTTWRVRALAAAALVAVGALSAAAESSCPGDAAIRTAVLEALGVSQGITIETGSCSIAAGTEVDAAVAEPGARLGRPARFRLLHNGRQVGYAIGTANGAVPHVRATRTLSASTVLTAADVEEAEGVLTGQLLQRLPTLAQVVGLTLARPLGAGEPLTAHAIKVPPAVRSGDRVVIRSTYGGVEARATGTALQTGRVGDVIRLVNTDTKRPLRGRIVKSGEVEVMHGS
jgi:flagella basal body P-ring formation protein FlgA